MGDAIEAIGIDEMQWQRGHRYLTLVYQIDEGCRRLLWVGQERRVKTLLRFFRWFGKERSGALRFICSDMWRPYLKVIAKRMSGRRNENGTTAEDSKTTSPWAVSDFRWL